MMVASKEYMEMSCTLSLPNGKTFFVYKLLKGRDKSNTQNSVIMFFKKQDGYAYAVASITISFIEGWLYAVQQYEEIYPLTDSQYFGFGEMLPHNILTRGPGVLPGVYAGE